MPIRPENRDRYPADWDAISARIKWDRAGGRCECRGQCGRPAEHLAADGRCHNVHGKPIWVPPQVAVELLVVASPVPGAAGVVQLTTAHLNHVPEDCRPENLMAACAGCHLHYDQDHHRQTREQTRVAVLLTQMDPLF